MSTQSCAQKNQLKKFVRNVQLDKQKPYDKRTLSQLTRVNAECSITNRACYVLHIISGEDGLMRIS